MLILSVAAMLAASAPPQPTHATLDRPYQASASSVSGVTVLTPTRDLHAALRGADTVIMHDFALSGGASVILDLERRDIVDAGATLRLNEAGTFARPDVVILGGHVAGDHESLAYLAISDTMTMGYIRTGGAQYIISSGPVDQNLGTVVYNVADLPEGEINIIETACNALEVPGRTPNASGRGVAMLGDAPCRVADVAIETDTEFRTDLFGGNATLAAEYATMLVGAVSEIYENDLNTILNITFLRIWTTPDPWNQNNSTTDQLFQFRDYWNDNMVGESRNGVHYFSGRGLGGGVAYIGALCYPEYDYALSANLNGFFPYPLQNGSDQNWDLFVVAHEWGHNFGAPHTHEQSPLANIDNCGSLGDCSQLPGTIMSYCHQCGSGTASVNLNFHPQNVNSWMLAYLGDTGLWEGSGALCDMTGSPLCADPGCVGDTNFDGSLTPADFGAWVAAFNAQGPACDQNGDGACTPADFGAWIANFNAGC